MLIRADQLDAYMGRTSSYVFQASPHCYPYGDARGRRLEDQCDGHPFRQVSPHHPDVERGSAFESNVCCPCSETAFHGACAVREGYEISVGPPGALRISSSWSVVS